MSTAQTGSCLQIRFSPNPYRTRQLHTPETLLSPAGRAGVMSNEQEVHRFGRASDVEMDKIMSDKDSLNTKRATKVAVQSLREYVLEYMPKLSFHIVVSV